MQKEVKNKKRMDKGQIFGKIMAGVLLAIMILAACSTCVYYIVANV